jgi:hypothetical protein
MLRQRARGGRADQSSPAHALHGTHNHAQPESPSQLRGRPVRQTQTSFDGETSSPSLRTLAIVAVGGVLAVGAAFFVRPSPKLDEKTAVVAPVVPANILGLSSATAQKPAPAPAPVVAAAPPVQPVKPQPPAMTPERQQLARMMSEAAEAPPSGRRPVAPEPAPVPVAAPAVGPGVTAFAPAPEQSSALQAVASLAPAAPPAAQAAGDAEKKRMADDAAQAIRDGDLAKARAILETSLAAGDEAAVFALAQTYDPVILSAMKIASPPADGKKARELYEKAQAAGIADARRRLAALTRFERRR